LFLCFWFEPNFAQNNWTEVRNEQQIKVFTRKVEGYAIHELKIVANFNVSAQQFYALLMNVSAQPDYLFSCIKTDLIQSKNKQEQIYYQQLKMPWPLKNRDGYFKQISYTNALNRTLVFETKAVAHLYAIDQDFVRVPALTATWKVQELSKNAIVGEYQVLLDSGGQIPAWLVNLFIDKAPFETVLNMRKLLATGMLK
jgi:ribosome-associated toxin RatA of RatAB toxin-antitoxin module